MTVPSVFGLPHLSEDAVAAFADGVLSEQAAARARRHCAECTECTEAVRGQREAAMMLRAASAPALPAGLLDRLAGLPMSAPLPSRFGGLPTALDPNGVPMFVAHRAPTKRSAPADRAAAGEPGTDPVGPEGDDRASFVGAPPRAIAHPDQARSGHRRMLLPVSLLASAAAVVAAGTLGSSAASFQPAVDQPAAVNLAPGLISGSSGAATGSGLQAGSTFAASTFDPSTDWVGHQAQIRPAVAASRPRPGP